MLPARERLILSWSKHQSLRRLVVALSRHEWLNTEAHNRSYEPALLIPTQVEATMRPLASVLMALICGSLLLGACASERVPAESTASRYSIEVLQHSIDPAIIPDRFAADFDEDGQIDRLIVTDTSLHVFLTGGGEFNYVVGQAQWDTGKWIEDIEIISLSPDRRYRSILLATHDYEPDGDWGIPSIQLVIVNDQGSLSVRRLHELSLPAVSVDCAWIESNDLPVCFYGAYVVSGVSWGVSVLIEVDVEDWRRLQSDSLARARASRDVAGREEAVRRWATDSSTRALRRKQQGLWAELGWIPAATGTPSAWELTRPFMDRQTFDDIAASQVPPEAVSADDTSAAVTRAFLEQYGPRDFVRSSWLGAMDSQEYDSILTAWQVPESASAVDVQVALLGAWQEKYHWVYSKDITREYRLPWPVPWPQYWLGTGDGLLMYGVQFFDFSGDGRLDLVAAGLHNRAFSAIQHRDGHFVDAGFHSSKDEHLGVWAPSATPGAELTTPPCVFFAMKRLTTGEPSDIIRCYDRASMEWYDVPFPDGNYFALEMGPAQGGSEYQGTRGMQLMLHVPFLE